ncbi:MAG: hypothetical protein V3T17_15525 [Pseudomonadales bacterium]
MEANTITAICALVASIFATSLSVWFAFKQQKHMKLSVKPIACFPARDYEHKIAVYLSNKGLGPMLVDELRVTDKNGNTEKDLISHMPNLNERFYWANFHGSCDGAVIEHGKSFELLALEGNSKDKSFRESRDLIRTQLKDLTIMVEYRDIDG